MTTFEVCASAPVLTGIRIMLVLFCSVLGLQAGPVKTSLMSFCEAGPTAQSNNSGNCAVSDPSGASASATSSGSLTDLSLGPALSFNGQMQVVANARQVYGTGSVIPQFPGEYSVVYSLSEDFVTSGPVRPGFVIFDSVTAGGLADNDSGASGTVTIGSHVSFWTIDGRTGCCGLVPSSPFSIPLGTGSTVQFYETAGGGGAGATSFLQLSAAINATFHIVEADGSNPHGREGQLVHWPATAAISERVTGNSYEAGIRVRRARSRLLGDYSVRGKTSASVTLGYRYATLTLGSARRGFSRILCYGQSGKQVDMAAFRSCGFPSRLATN